MNHLRGIDWKLLLFAWLACYAVPWLASSVLLSALITQDGVVSGWRLVAFNSYLVLHFLCMPLAAGYFTARYAKNRPQLHVLLVVVLGFVALCSVSSSPFLAQAIAAVASLAMASLGAFVHVRSRNSEA